ncbi:MAG: hypothetical protein A2Z06_01300 [Candidatus Glassbacteria bacterium RBG_16_58_8]|uniref:AAA domain-containing protein n=1 Tax=Candidatus Glassbacteria bacterium RBG_16_58_8 TaxID=1817866 RepID=A0A1F5YCT5_9BACT|nr:MAG: hypothetical protein A2Z06_01300 [Candidatus Glassbacteria bacterium RBG_16_58_8]
MKKLAVLNHKGGSGKTTTAINLGAALALKGKKVLLIDLDPQGGLTEALMVDLGDHLPTVSEILTGEAEPKAAYRTVRGLTVIPAGPDLAETEKRLIQERPRDAVLALKEALSGVRGFDYVLVDCPPSLGTLALGGVVYAGAVIIPLQAQYMALAGLEKVLRMIAAIREAGIPLEIDGVLPCLYDVRTNLSRQVEEKVREAFGKKVFKTIIRQSVSLAEAPARGMDIFAYRPNSRGAEDYAALAEEVIRHG